MVLHYVYLFFFKKKLKRKLRQPLNHQILCTLHSLINIVIDKVCRLFNLIFWEMQFIFIMLNVSLPTIALGCGSAVEKRLLLCGVLSGLLAQALWPLQFGADTCSEG